MGAKSFTDCTAHLSPVRKVHIDTHNFFVLEGGVYM